jgi:hypothetical protein
MFQVITLMSESPRRGEPSYAANESRGETSGDASGQDDVPAAVGARARWLLSSLAPRLDR